MLIIKCTILVPAYNEERRIKLFLQELAMLREKNNSIKEVVVIDDSSTDSTADIVRKFDGIKLLSYKPNRGKGYAVKHGVMHAKGDSIIFIDADGSISPDQIPKMLEKLEQYDVVVGDRSLKNSVVKNVGTRKLTGNLFNFYVGLIFNSDIKDNLCGFKGFKADVAKNLFGDLISERWIFDVELFYKIRKRGYTLYKLPFVWSHKKGSKLKLLDPLKMFFELIMLRIKLIGK